MLENLSQENKSKLILDQEALERIKQLQVEQSQEVTVESLQKKIQEEFNKVETYSDKIIDIPDRQEKQITELNGAESNLADEMAKVTEEVKRTKTSFFDRTKNYVISLATMVASIGNVAANTKQEVKTQDKIRFEKPTVQDSLDLYNNSIKVEKYYKDKKYNTDGPKKVKEDPFKTMEDDRTTFKTLNEAKGLVPIAYPLKNGMTSDRYAQITKKQLPPLPDSIYYKKLDDNKFYQRESNNGILDTRSPMQLYDKRIKPHVQETFTNNVEGDLLKKDVIKYFKYDPVAIKPVSMLTKKEKIERYNKYGDKSGIPNPIKKIEETTKKDTTIAPKKETLKTNKIETKNDKIIYVEDKNDPRLKEYQDSLFYYKKYNDLYNFTHGPYGNLEKDITEKDFKNYDKNLLADHESKKGLTVRWINNKNEQDWGTINDYLKVKPYLKHVPEKFSKTTYRDTDPFYKKPTIEVKYQPKPKLTEVGLKPIEAVKIPTEQTEANPLANLKQKEIIKNPEKTGYTVRVGEKLYYFSKENLNKFESDKTTHYNVSEKGDGTEKHLVWWGGNDQGQNLQQVAERLGIKLPVAFDTQKQEFDK